MNSQKVLIVEDTRSLSLFMRGKIESNLHFETVAAFNFHEAREILTANDNFFAAVLDLNLPDAPDGEIVEFVLARKIPSIVLTATYDDELRERMLALNVVDYVVKQTVWSVEHVVGIIDRLHRNQSTKVLIVDDSSGLRTYYRRLLEIQKFQVLDASDGGKAVEILDAHPDIRLILTDYNMPNMDGFELISRVRRKFSKDRIAVIGLSSQTGGSLSARFLKMGANDFLKKPFESEELYARVNQNIELIEMVAELREAATRDALTRLFNRRYCLDQGQKLYAEAKKGGASLCIGILDIDFFKKINDVYGHEAGDFALKRMAAQLRETVDRHGVACRFGGEEFCLLLSGMEPAGAAALFEEIRRKVEADHFVYGGETIRFTVSTGVACRLGDSLEEMIRRADDMLYKAKRDGRNRIESEPRSPEAIP